MKSATLIFIIANLSLQMCIFYVKVMWTHWWKKPDKGRLAPDRRPLMLVSSAMPMSIVKAAAFEQTPLSHTVKPTNRYTAQGCSQPGVTQGFFVLGPLLCHTMACFHVISISVIYGEDYPCAHYFLWRLPLWHYFYVPWLIMTS